MLHQNTKSIFLIDEFHKKESRLWRSGETTGSIPRTRSLLTRPLLPRKKRKEKKMNFTRTVLMFHAPFTGLPFYCLQYLNTQNQVGVQRCPQKLMVSAYCLLNPKSIPSGGSQWPFLAPLGKSSEPPQSFVAPTELFSPIGASRCQDQLASQWWAPSAFAPLHRHLPPAFLGQLGFLLQFFLVSFAL